MVLNENVTCVDITNIYNLKHPVKQNAISSLKAKYSQYKVAQTSPPFSLRKNFKKLVKRSSGFFSILKRYDLYVLHAFSAKIRISKVDGEFS